MINSISFGFKNTRFEIEYYSLDIKVLETIIDIIRQTFGFTVKAIDPPLPSVRLALRLQLKTNCQLNIYTKKGYLTAEEFGKVAYIFSICGS